MDKKWLGCAVPWILLALVVPGPCQGIYVTDLGITRYVIRLEPDFDRNIVACVVRTLVQNFSSHAVGSVEIGLCSGEDADTFEHEMRTIASEEKGRKERVAFTFTRKKSGGGSLPERSVYEIPLGASLPPGGRVWLEFAYVLRGKPKQSAFPIFENAGAVKELYMIADYDWLPRISYQPSPGVFSNICRASWDLKVSYPSSYASAVDGELVRKDEAGGLRVEDWKSVTGGVPQLFIGPYDVIRDERGGIRLEMNVPRDPQLRASASALVGDLFKILKLYTGLFGDPGGSTFRFICSYTQNGAHGLHMGLVAQPGYLRTSDIETIAHEISHTWWGSTITSYNEGSKFLRESLAGFSSAWAMRELRGPAYFRNSLLQFKADAFFRYPARNEEQKQYPVIEQPGYDFSGIVQACYRKGPLILDEVRRELGDSVFLACLGEFARKYKDRNVTMADFIRTFDETSKTNLDARFRQLCWSARPASYELVGFTSIRKGDHFATTVKIRNTGEMAARCPILLTMREGEKRDAFTCPPGTETEFRCETPRDVVQVALDPDADAFQYRPEQRFLVWTKLDESTFGGLNWSWFNKSYALYRLGRYPEAIRTITTYLDRYMVMKDIAGIQELGRDPLYSSYLFSRGLYHYAQKERDRAEEDVKAAIPGLLACLLDKRFLVSTAYAGVVQEKTPEQDLMSLLGLLTGKTPTPNHLGNDEAKKQALRDWLKWWEDRGRHAGLNLKALERYPAGTSP